MNEARTFSHIVDNQPGMVDVSQKQPTLRKAVARATVSMPSQVTDKLLEGDLYTKKGPVFHTAIVAGTMAVKNTHQLIPFCHGLNIEGITFDIKIVRPGLVEIIVMVKSFGRTGVEMECLTGASIAALTIYDMCKSLSCDMEVVSIKLLEKTGGKHDKHA
jgi:cyclic pyranopterin monophosphate synthase